MRANLSKFSIANLEGEKTIPQKSTMDRIIKSLELAGVEFIEDGVRLKKETITILDGEDWFLKLLDDVHYTLLQSDNKELLIEFADENKSPPEVVEKVIAMRKDGIKMRIMICEGETNIMGPLDEYRYIPKELYRNYVSMIYADKFLITTEDGKKGFVIKNNLLAQSRKNMFDIAWNCLYIPKISSCKDRYL